MGFQKNNKIKKTDKIDVFFNNLNRFKKQIFIPAIIGVVVSFVLIYLIASLKLFGLDNRYFIGFFKAFIATAMLQHSFNFLGQEIATNQGFDFFKNKMLDNLMTIITFFVSIFLTTTTIIYLLLFKIANKMTKLKEKEVLEGSLLLEEEELIKKQKKAGLKGAPIGHKGAVFPSELEKQHMFIAGASGTGKTILMRRMYTYYLKNRKGAKFIIHDVKGDYVAKFYNKNTDYIFNLNDARSINLNLFDYIESSSDIKSIVASIIPERKEEKDPIWTNSARTILEGIISYCYLNNTRSNQAIIELINLSPDELAEKLEEYKTLSPTINDAFIFLTNGSEGQIGNIFSNFKSRVTYFTSMPTDIDQKESFNIKKWLTSFETSTLFLLNDVKNKDLNAIRISVFLNIFVKELLNLDNSLENVIATKKNGYNPKNYFIFLDEFGSLQKMDAIVDLLALGRSFGAKVIIGIQEIQRLFYIYGKELTSTIVNNTTSKVILRQNEAETADYIAKLIGKQKIETLTIGNTASAGKNDNRDTASFNKQKKVEETVLGSTIMQLENNEYIVKVDKDFWANIKTKFIKEIDDFDDINPPFVANETLLLLKNSENKSESKSVDIDPDPKELPKTEKENNSQKEEIEEDEENFTSEDSSLGF